MANTSRCNDDRCQGVTCFLKPPLVLRDCSTSLIGGALLLLIWTTRWLQPPPSKPKTADSADDKETERKSKPGDLQPETATDSIQWWAASNDEAALLCGSTGEDVTTNNGTMVLGAAENSGDEAVDGDLGWNRMEAVTKYPRVQWSKLNLDGNWAWAQFAYKGFSLLGPTAAVATKFITGFTLLGPRSIVGFTLLSPSFTMGFTLLGPGKHNRNMNLPEIEYLVFAITPTDKGSAASA